jgi:hypothetical protein
LDISIERGIAEVVHHTGSSNNAEELINVKIRLEPCSTSSISEARTLTPDRSVTSSYLSCDACGTLTHIDLLDGKDDGTGNFTILECRKCYGPGWAPLAADQVRYRYECPECDHRWHDVWSTQAGDANCPMCGKRHIRPNEVEDVPWLRTPQSS